MPLSTPKSFSTSYSSASVYFSIHYTSVQEKNKKANIFLYKKPSKCVFYIIIIIILHTQYYWSKSVIRKRQGGAEYTGGMIPKQKNFNMYFPYIHSYIHILFYYYCCCWYFFYMFLLELLLLLIFYILLFFNEYNNKI